jgi:hypothetical protein
MDRGRKNYLSFFILINFFFDSRSYGNNTMYVRYECNRRIHRAQFKFVKYQHNKMPVRLNFSFILIKN